MKFGSVNNPGLIDFSLPNDHKETKRVLNNFNYDKPTDIYVGCAKWNRADLKGFYPRGTKDELVYYASQFNAIELNASFYRIFSSEQFEKWYQKTPNNFKFFPKLNQEISHRRRLSNTNVIINDFLTSAVKLKEKLGTMFLQMPSDFTPNYFDRVVTFVNNWPKHLPLAIEFRHTDWYNDTMVANELYDLLEQNNIANCIVDTAGRRDIMHMRLTNGIAFVRYVGANHPSDFTRLDDWVQRLKVWQLQGVREINFFIHQNIEEDSPLLSAYFIKKLNTALGTNLKAPKDNTTINIQQTLF